MATDCGICLYSENDGSCEFFHAKEVRAAKEHKCYECYQPIPKGTIHQYAAGKYEGDFWSARTCLVCAEIRKAFYCDGPEMYGEFWTQMHEDDVFSQMTTGCLERLTTPEAKKELLRRWNEWKFDSAKR